MESNSNNVGGCLAQPLRADAGGVYVRDATAADLPAVNAILESAVAGWGLSPRVLRLSLPALHYNAMDLASMTIRVASDGANLIGFGGYEPADPGDAPPGRRALLVHGIYILPERQGQRIGALLVADADHAARSAGAHGLSTRAWRESVRYFEMLGFTPFDAARAGKYPLHMWRPCT